MTIQEEIREGVVSILQQPLQVTWQGDAVSTMEKGIENQGDEILSYLHSQGVVIKVERELPKNPWSGWKSILDPTILGMNKKRAEAYKMAQDDMAGYVAVEPLIKDDK